VVANPTVVVVVVAADPTAPEWWWWRRTRRWWWLWWRRTDVPLRALGLEPDLLDPTSSPLTLLGADLLGPNGGEGVQNKRSVGMVQPVSPLFLRHPGAAWGGGAACSSFALVQGAGATAEAREALAGALGAMPTDWGPPADASEIWIPR
jgi:hypothetical protein